MDISNGPMGLHHPIDIDYQSDQIPHRHYRPYLSLRDRMTNNNNNRNPPNLRNTHHASPILTPLHRLIVEFCDFNYQSQQHRIGAMAQMHITGITERSRERNPFFVSISCTRCSFNVLHLMKLTVRRGLPLVSVGERIKICSIRCGMSELGTLDSSMRLSKLKIR